MVGVLLFSALSAAAGEPFVPGDAGEVLYEIPQALRQQGEAVSAARRAWMDDPDDLERALAVAGADFRLGQETGDPRFYGYARGALSRWWDLRDAPPRVLALRAKLKETDHDYAGAIADLEALVAQRPRETQPWIELANLHRVRGDYAAAGVAVDALASFAPAVPVALARIPLLAVTGRLDEAESQLAAVLPAVRAGWTSALPWAEIMQAQLAVARGDDVRAEAVYREAIARGNDAGYLRRAYADLLLSQGRDAEALALAEGDTADTGMLLRAAIAAKRLGDGRAVAWRDELRQRFEAVRQRGGEPHGRFEARFTLEVLNEPDRALALALANWGKQREQLDSRHVLAAALAARRPDAAETVIAFLRQHGTEDAELQALIEQLEALP
jgi:tetratricopeptide (TPR) repeat protein